MKETREKSRQKSLI